MKATRPGAAAAAALTVLLVASCGGPPHKATTSRPPPAISATPVPKDSGAEPVPAGTPGQPRGGNPSWPDNANDLDAVTDAVLVTLSRWDTRIDNSRNDAARRALPYLGGQYAKAVREPTSGGGGADWLDLVKHDGYTTATVERANQDGAPADTDKAASRVRIVTVTPHGANGWTGTVTTSTYFVTLGRSVTGSPWQVIGVTTA